MIEFELEIPSLTEDGIKLDDSFNNVWQLNSTSMVD